MRKRFFLDPALFLSAICIFGAVSCFIEQIFPPHIELSSLQRTVLRVLFVFSMVFFTSPITLTEQRETFVKFVTGKIRMIGCAEGFRIKFFWLPVLHAFVTVLLCMQIEKYVFKDTNSIVFFLIYFGIYEILNIPFIILQLRKGYKEFKSANKNILK
jgi:hypothetical protein